MTTPKLHNGLYALLALQLVLVFVTATRDSGDAVNYKQEPVLPGFDANAVTRLQIFAEGGAKPAIDLVKNAGKWSLASHFNYPAETSKVTAVLAPFAKMTAGEPVATSASRHKQLKVADGAFDKKVVITANGKDTTLYLGANAGLRRTAVRRGNEEIVLGATGVTTSSISPTSREWVAKYYFEIQRDDIEKIHVQRGTSSTELDRSAPVGAGSGSGSGAGSGSGSGVGSGSAAPTPTWRISFDGAPVVLGPNEKIDDFAINTVISNVASMEALPANPAKDVSKPTAVITLTKKGGTTIVFDVIAEGEEYWVKQRGSDRATTLAEKMRLETVVNVDRSTLVAKTNPAPGTGSGSGSGSGAPKAPIVPKPPGPPPGPPKRP